MKRWPASTFEESREPIIQVMRRNALANVTVPFSCVRDDTVESMSAVVAVLVVLTEGSELSAEFLSDVCWAVV